MDNQTDIEIYLMKQPVDAIIEWLGETFDNCSEADVRGRSYNLTVTHNEQSIPVNIVENAAGKAWTSVWFDSTSTPWHCDADCARSAHKMLAGRVRCNASFWQEGAGNMDEWLEIGQDGSEKLIDWPS
ncbi:hypothetical protein [Parendozoicomonas haliclonae]|uniref:Uncharacterized protein n=1 Tax=Parendozoicomonas haliclonae TaxID=1960125 RepID=A0A1X7AQS5_9GAMM|nr:hypothetical protein [Parendozoicomonas haliclonae]SMA50492.1 hypothetical protein EHSB41UT_04303 [Parendozoicomonas haliclonae]